MRARSTSLNGRLAASASPNIPIDTDTNVRDGHTTDTNYILHVIQISSGVDKDFYNTIYFPGTGPRATHFVWCTGGTGLYDCNTIARREFVRTRRQDRRLVELNFELDEWRSPPRI